MTYSSFVNETPTPTLTPTPTAKENEMSYFDTDIAARPSLTDLWARLAVMPNSFINEIVKEKFSDTDSFNFSTLEKLITGQTISDYTEILQFRYDFYKIFTYIYPRYDTDLITFNNIPLAYMLIALCYIFPYHVSNVNKRRLL